MIKVAFFSPASGNKWMGGINYFIGLINALHSVQSKKIELVLIVPTKENNEIINNFKNLEVIPTNLLKKFSLSWILRKALAKIFSRDILMEWFLKKNGISVLSHSGHLGKNSSIKTIGWIPDFQHIKLPDFFSEQEKMIRDAAFASLAKNCTRIILSSYDAQQDFIRFQFQYAKKSNVLQFASDLKIPSDDFDSIKAKYDLPDKYFHLPNQFWAHKNHAVVIDALSELKRDSFPVTVICTGHTEDSRHPDYFNNLLKHLDLRGERESFRILGVIPRDHLYSIMQNAVAVINPSLFEGWSTSVEEAKALGKTIILSDIAVHKEQNSPRSFYFSSNSSSELAQHMKTIFNNYEKNVDIKIQNDAKNDARNRVRIYGENFQNIVIDALK